MIDRIARNVVYLGAIGAALYGIASYSYVVFHSTVEMFSMVVAASVLIVAWHGRKLLDSDYLLLIGMSYLAFAVLDVPHILSFEGIRAFPGFGTELTEQLYAAQRFVLSATFLVAPWLLTRRRRLNPFVAFAAYAAFTLVALLSIMVWRIFPQMVVAGEPTLFARLGGVASDMAYAAGIAALVVHRSRFDREVLWLLSGSAVSFVVADAMFGFSAGTSDTFNLLGQFAQGLGFFLTYKAVVETAYRRPYALLYKQLSDRESAIRASEGRYREVAETLQTAMMRIPESLRNVRVTHEYLSSSDVARIGGDFFDVFELDDRYVGFLLGDVSGKGLPASTTTAEVKSTVRAFAHLDPDPEYVLREANELLFTLLEESQFVTAVYGVVDVADGSVRLASAGHEEPVLCLADGCRIAHPSTNVPLGVLPDADFASYTAVLAPGEAVVVYTDGVVDARRDGELYGRERLRTFVERHAAGDVEAIAGEMVADVVSFAAGRLADDLAVMTICYSPGDGGGDTADGASTASAPRHPALPRH